MTDALDPIITRAVGDVCDRPRRISPLVAETVVRRAAHEAYRLGRRDAIAELLTVQQAAAVLGINERNVRRLAQRYGLGWRIGREWLFTSDDLAGLRERSTGRPGRPPKRELTTY